MMHQAAQPPFATTAIIYAVAIALLVWRMARRQRISVTRLWVMPVILLLITGFSIWANMYATELQGQLPPPDWEVAGVLVLGAVLGVPLGFLRGRHSVVKPADRAGVMEVHSSPVIVIIWLAAFLARGAVRAFLPQAHASAALTADGLLAFAMAALIASYYAIYRKYRVVLQQAPTA